MTIATKHHGIVGWYSAWGGDRCRSDLPTERSWTTVTAILSQIGCPPKRVSSSAPDMKIAEKILPSFMLSELSRVRSQSNVGRGRWSGDPQVQVLSEPTHTDASADSFTLARKTGLCIDAFRMLPEMWWTPKPDVCVSDKRPRATRSKPRRAVVVATSHVATPAAQPWLRLRHLRRQFVLCRDDELLGHASIEMTMRYTHLSTATNRDAARALDAPGGDGLPPTKRNGS